MPSLLWRSGQNKRVGRGTVSALGHGVSESPPSGWRWGLTSLAALELGPLGLDSNDITVLHGLWMESRDRTSQFLIIVQAQGSLDKFQFYFCSSSFGGIVADFSFIILFIYFVCINMQRTAHSNQCSPLITWVPGTEIRLSGLVVSSFIRHHFPSLFLLLLLGWFFFYDYECFALMYICVTHVSLLTTKLRRP